MLLRKKSKVQFRWKKVHDILRYCLKELFNFNGNRTKDFIENKVFATIPLLLAFSDVVSQRRHVCGITSLARKERQSTIFHMLYIYICIYKRCKQRVNIFGRLCHKDSNTISHLVDKLTTTNPPPPPTHTHTHTHTHKRKKISFFLWNFMSEHTFWHFFKISKMK